LEHGNCRRQTHNALDFLVLRVVVVASVIERKLFRLEELEVVDWTSACGRAIPNMEMMEAKQVARR